MKKYRALPFFKGMKLFCGEWHPMPERPPAEFKKELLNVSKAPAANEPFIGVSYFQYQVAYSKSGPERGFGMFELGTQKIGYTNYITSDPAQNHPVNCLKPKPAVGTIAAVWNGTGATHGLCKTDDRKDSNVVV